MHIIPFIPHVFASLVGLGAGYISWWHIVEVVTIAGEPGEVRWVYPVVIDGMILGCAAVGLRQRHYERPVGAWTRIGLWFGVLVTVAANLESARNGNGWQSYIVAVVPAAAFVILTEVLLSRDVSTRTVAAKPSPAPRRSGDKTRLGGRPSMRARVAAAVAKSPAAKPVEIAARVGTSERTVQRHLKAQGVSS